jgi:hypothetical protein
MNKMDKLADEWESLDEKTREMARQIIKAFAEEGLSICSAKEVFRACEIYVEFNSKIIVGN